MAKVTSVFCFLFFSLFANSQTVDFTFQSANGLLCNSSTIQFTQNCTGNPTSFIWNLGNGLKSTSPNPSTSYIYAGSYSVKLIAIYPQKQVAITKTIVISPDIVPILSADRNYICQPGVINFTTSSNGNIAKYEWDFSDNTGLTTTQANINSHTFSNYGKHSVIVKATDMSGCFGYDTISVDVKKIPITATSIPPLGCIPANTKFNTNATLPLNSSVTNYILNFGDGSTPITTSNSTTNHTYSIVGSFLPTVTVTTNEGCTNTFNVPAVAYGTPPTSPIAYPKKTIVCGSDSAGFVAKAINANRYLWDFGDGTTASVTDTFTQHKYSALGAKTVTVTPFFNGCSGTPISFQITVVGVIAKYVFTNVTCTDKKTFLFGNVSLGNKTSIAWDFGDGTPIVTTFNSTHTFPPSGRFITTLTITDAASGCIDTFSRPIFTADPILVNPDLSICKNSSTTFKISNTYNNPSASYIWSIVGRPLSSGNDSTLTIKATILGNFNNYVIIRNGPGYCTDTIPLSHPILVRGPNLNFTTPANICFTDLLNITNNSKPFVAAETVTLWYWNYGISVSNDTIYQPAPIQFNAPRSFNITLTGIDINGCKDSLTKSVIVNPLPFLRVFPQSDTICSGQGDSLFALHSDNILWTPSAGLSCTTCDSVGANPSVTTQYIVRATTPFNCSIQDSILVTVIPNFTVIPMKVNQYICLGDEVTLDVGPKDKIIVWSPPTGLSSTNIFTPIARPNQTTTYTATLKDSLGCFTRTANITVFIKTVPTVDAGPNKTVPYNSTFNISPTYSSNVKSYIWTPATLLNCSTCPAPAGIASKSETYKIEVTSDSGCIATDSILIAIECKESNLLMPKAFSPNNDNLNDIYYPLARGIKTISHFAIYNREGQLLYEARDFLPNDRSFGWNGEFKGTRQAPRAYVFMLEAICDLGQRITKSGSFLLLR
ncbi:MAG: PKD domain-containing protein [Ferruginibacter sp.]